MSKNEAVEVEAVEVEASTKATIKVDREKYQTTRSASGAKSLNNGDQVAELLNGLDVEAVHDIGSEALETDTREKYAHLNGGMQRMNVGNRLRGFVNKAPEGEDRLAYLTQIAEPHIVKAKEAAEEKAAAKAAEVEAE